MYEVLLTRIFSVTMWYHFAFVAISVAMFGMTVGALVVYLDRSGSPRRPSSTSLRSSAHSSPLYRRELPDAAEHSLPGTPLGRRRLGDCPDLRHRCRAVRHQRHPRGAAPHPFCQSTSRVCTPSTWSGAALGCVLLVWLLDVTDGPTAVLAISALAAVGATGVRDGRRRRRVDAGERRGGRVAVRGSRRRTRRSCGAASRCCASST